MGDCRIMKKPQAKPQTVGRQHRRVWQLSLQYPVAVRADGIWRGVLHANKTFTCISGALTSRCFDARLGKHTHARSCLYIKAISEVHCQRSRNSSHPVKHASTHPQIGDHPHGSNHPSPHLAVMASLTVERAEECKGEVPRRARANTIQIFS